MHHRRADEYGDEKQHPPEEADYGKEDGKIAESPHAPKIVGGYLIDC